MATTFKLLNPASDVVTTKNLLHEAIPITGALVSGTYGTLNIKNYAHGIFQSVYDYPYLSSSANHILDLTCGYPATSSLSGVLSTQNAKKINIYNQMAQVLVGFDQDNNVRRFDQDGDLTGGTKINEAYIINFTRLLSKDEIKKGSFTLELGVSASYATPFGERVTLKDTNGATTYFANSPAGEYAILYISNSAGTPLTASITGSTQQPAGLLYYQTGDVILSSSCMGSLLSSSAAEAAGLFSASADGSNINTVLSGTAISGNCDALRHRIYNISFNNTTELNSTVYFCRSNHGEFNYSSNPTYLSSSKMVVKNVASDIPISYVTTVGLYSPDNELMAVAKLSEPLKKDPTIEFTLRVRTDF